jgi:hypothetical protein
MIARYFMPIVLVASMLACHGQVAEKEVDDTAQQAEGFGWLDQYQNGMRILDALAALSPEEAKKLPIDAYRNQQIALPGGAASPGATNDLMTGHGYYVRVVNPEQKDLRPQAVTWGVFIMGKILQVLPENKILVIEVSEENYQVMSTL